MRIEKTIVMLAAKDIDTLERKGADVEEIHFGTIREAKLRAKWVLTEEYRINCEASERLGYSRVLVNGECIADYFGK